MRICIVAEGCYPYVVGGVSSWIHSLIRSFPGQEFVILAIVSDRSMRGKYVYELPSNVTEVHEIYLNDSDWSKKRMRKRRMNKKEYHALRSLLLGQKIEWEVLFDFFQKRKGSLNGMLMGRDFLDAVTEFYQLNYSQVVFTDFLWMMRSIYLPLFTVLQTELPKADLYHCICTGYAGVLGSMAKYFHGGRLMISEHGIYTREREEELIMAKWVKGIYTNIWIEQFYKMSSLAYERADMVTSLYEHARSLQVELGCPMEKTKIVPNGVRVEDFQNLSGKREEDQGKINIGAVLRVTPVKDVMTLLQAFSFAKMQEPALKLWIMGTWEEDSEYAQECFDLVRTMGIQDVEFTGNVDMQEYYGRMDMTILTSISEGQPLVILESFAAHKPVIATNVGNSRGLILGEQDDFGPAGIVTRIMNVEDTAYAMTALAGNEEMRVQMGENGYQRVMALYQLSHLQDAYRNIYQDFAESMQLPWKEETADRENAEKENQEKSSQDETDPDDAEKEPQPDADGGRD